MENEDTEYIEGNGDDFLKYIFSKEPREKNSVKLELDPPDEGVKLGLHIFQELLMVFTMALKYLYSDGEDLNITTITSEDIDKINRHFNSFGFSVLVERFTIQDYLSNMKVPNFFKNKELIKDDTLLRDIYYETFTNDNIYRITFDFIR
jgi:hypothetical protein